MQAVEESFYCDVLITRMLRIPRKSVTSASESAVICGHIWRYRSEAGIAQKRKVKVLLLRQGWSGERKYVFCFVSFCCVRARGVRRGGGRVKGRVLPAVRYYRPAIVISPATVPI